MSNTNEALLQELEELQKGYVLRLPGKLDQMQAVIHSMQENRSRPDALGLLHKYAHNLAGSAGTYDCPEVSIAARSYEKLIDQFLDADSALELKAFVQLEQCFNKLQMVVQCTVNTVNAPAKTGDKTAGPG